MNIQHRRLIYYRQAESNVSIKCNKYNFPIISEFTKNKEVQQCQRVKDFSVKEYTGGDDGENKAVDENLTKLYHVKFIMDCER